MDFDDKVVLLTVSIQVDYKLADNLEKVLKSNSTKKILSNHQKLQSSYKLWRDCQQLFPVRSELKMLTPVTKW